MQLIHELKHSCYSLKINHCVMRRLFPKFRMKGITGFLQHYKRYDFMSPKYEGDPVSLNDEQALAVKTTVTEIEERMCAMMGVPLPSIGELIMENKRLSMIGDGLCLFLSALSCSYTCSSLSPFLLTFPPLTCATCLGNPAVERVRRAGDKAKGPGKGKKKKIRKEVRSLMAIQPVACLPLLPDNPELPLSLSTSRSPLRCPPSTTL